MTEWKKIEDIHIGTIGYVSFLTRYHKYIKLICKVLSCTKDRIEVVPIASDGTCIWIDKGEIFRSEAF